MRLKATTSATGQNLAGVPKRYFILIPSLIKQSTQGPCACRTCDWSSQSRVRGGERRLRWAPRKIRPEGYRRSLWVLHAVSIWYRSLTRRSTQTSRDWPLGFKPKTSSSTLLAVVEAGGPSTWAGAPFGGICTRPSVRNLAKWGERMSKPCH